MQKDAKLEYERMKDFFSFYVERYFNLAGLPPEKRPIAVLEVLEKRSMKLAFNGLRQAVNDCMEMSSHLSREEVENLDSLLRGRGIVTLSEMRRRYSKDYAKIMKRERIKNETEYYLLRNVLNDPTEKTPEERGLLEKLISDYEAYLLLPYKDG
jgi:hypothetical protein